MGQQFLSRLGKTGGQVDGPVAATELRAAPTIIHGYLVICGHRRSPLVGNRLGRTGHVV